MAWDLPTCMSTSVGIDHFYSNYGGCDVILLVLENYFIIHIFVVVFSSFLHGLSYSMKQFKHPSFMINIMN